MNEFQDLSKYKNPVGVRGRNVLWVQAWRVVSSTLWCWSPKFAHFFRVWLLRFFGGKIGKGGRISSSCQITYPWFFTAGDYFWAGDESVIYNLARISFGDHVALAHKVYLCTGSHNIERETFDIETLPINIADQVWIANDVFIRGGVNVGRGVVVSARSTVLSNCDSGFVYAGSPARKIRKRKVSSRMAELK